jgi:hypothetical protein
MLWFDYNIETGPGGHWRVEQEAVDKGLYKEGDVFIVRNGWLIKQEDLTAMVMKYETTKQTNA